MLDVDVEGGKSAPTKSGHAGCLDRRRGSRQDLRRLGVAMQVACGDAAAVMRGWRNPAQREVARWKPVTSSRGDGDDRVQRRYGPMGQRGCRARVGAAA
jgi:hypothetical protein